MTFDGEVIGVESAGDDVKVTMSNLRCRNAAEWREYSPAAVFRMPLSSAKTFYIGRTVRITVDAK